MTTVAYRDGIMAADSGAWLSNVAYRTARKLAVGPDGSLHGVCGNHGEADAYLTWVRDGMVGEPPKPQQIDLSVGRSTFLALAVWPNGKLSLWTASGRESYTAAPYMAIGAGSEMAIGAMAAGATAEQAVEIVADNSDYARLPVHSIALP